VPSHRTTQLTAKFCPVTARTNGAPPAIVDAGDSDAITGFAAVIVRVRLFEIAPPGPEAVMAAESSPFDRPAGAAAVNWVVLTNVVASGNPFHNTDAPAVNPIPFTVSVTEVPAVIELGVRLVRVDAWG
jgi:hypothetical protein